MLADLLQAVDLRNAVVNAFVDAYAKPPPTKLAGPDALRYLYDRTPEKSPMRRLCVDFAISRLNRDSFDTSVARYPEDFVNAVAMQALRQVSTIEPHAMEKRRSEYLEKEDCAFWRDTPGRRPGNTDAKADASQHLWA